MASLTAVCFGGPMNERVMSGTHPVMEVAVPTPFSALVSGAPVAPHRTEMYRWERFWWGTTGGRWAGDCWVYAGYPINRIEYGLRASAFLSGCWARV